MPAASPPPTEVKIVDSPPPAPPPAPTSAIQASSIAPPATPAAVKPGSAMDRMRQELAKKAKPTNAPPDRPASETPPEVKAADTQAASSEKPPPEETPPPGAGEEVPKEFDTADIKDPKTGKVNPWKLVNKYKDRIKTMEKEIGEAKTGALPEQQKKQYLTQIETLQKRADALEQEMRFLDYQKSEDFQEKYDKPYQSAWQAAMQELSEIAIVDPVSQKKRPVTVDDMMDLVQKPLGLAKEEAEEKFGIFVDEVMRHRDKIRTLLKNQQEALKKAKEESSTLLKLRSEMAEQQQAKLSQEITETWNKANEEVRADKKHGRWFAPVEGDQDGNQRLAKGFELVDRALAENPGDPNLTPDQRKAIVQRHAAIRNRAAAYGKLVATVTRAEARIKELEAALAKFQVTQPETGGAIPPASPGHPASARESVFAELRRRAK